MAISFTISWFSGFWFEMFVGCGVLLVFEWLCSNKCALKNIAHVGKLFYIRWNPRPIAAWTVMRLQTNALGAWSSLGWRVSNWWAYRFCEQLLLRSNACWNGTGLNRTQGSQYIGYCELPNASWCSWSRHCCVTVASIYNKVVCKRVPVWWGRYRKF